MAEFGLEVIVVTGEINSGKSSLFEMLVESERQNGISPTGIIARGIFDNGNKTGFEIIDLSSGKTKPLARINWDIPESFPVGKYIFSQKGFDFACRALLNYEQRGVVFLDEVGPYELNGNGYYYCLKQLLDSDISRLYVAVRSSCLEEFKIRFLAGKKNRIVNTDNLS